MKRTLSFDRIATTEESEDPVIKAVFPDSGSFMVFNVDRDSHLIRITHVKSEIEGDMKKMIDEITEQIGIYHIRFMNPVDHLTPGKRLLDVLDGFEKIVVDMRDLDSPLDEIDAYDGIWRSERGSEGDSEGND